MGASKKSSSMWNSSDRNRKEGKEMWDLLLDQEHKERMKYMKRAKKLLFDMHHSEAVYSYIPFSASFFRQIEGYFPSKLQR